jgi:diaminopimelate decarboxylase
MVTVGVIRNEQDTARGKDFQVLFPESCSDIEVQAAITSKCASGEPGFFVDMAHFTRRCTMVSVVAAQYGVRLLYAVKSFTNDEVLWTAAESGIGFDVSNKQEFDIVTRNAGSRPFISMTSPGLPRDERDHICRMIRAGDIVRFYCDSLRQLRDFCSMLRGSDVGIRVNLNGETIPEGIPIFGPSRFGVQLSELTTARAIASSFGCRLRWIHMHNASEVNDLSSFLTAGRLMLQRSQEAGIELTSMDLGGGLREPADAFSLNKFFAALRSVVPSGVELILEPGQFWMRDCGYLSTQVIDLKQFEACIVLVTDCGTLNHLQWSVPAFPQLGPIAVGDARPYLVCGRTCFEHDVVGRTAASPGCPAPLPDSWLVLGDVSGYSLELGSTFNGVPPREPILVPGGPRREPI